MADCKNLECTSEAKKHRTYCSRSCYLATVQQNCISRKAARPQCMYTVCDNTAKWNMHHGVYNTYCSKSCAAKDNVDAVSVKRKKTNLERYGVENAFQSTVIQAKIKTSNLRKYGVENPMQSDEIIKSRESKFMSTYGVTNPTYMHLSPDTIDKIKDEKWLTSENTTKSVNQIAKELGVSGNCIRDQFINFNITPNRFNDSVFESEVKQFISCLGLEYQSSRSVIPPKELDIYIPEKQVAIECNGTYWHSELQGRDKLYHLNKTIACKEKGIHLIHIWDHEWNAKQELIKSRIKSKLGINERIFARKCQVQEINSPTSKLFISDNHIQGNCPASIRYGIFHEGDLIGVMTFGKSIYNKKYEYELLRYCTKQGINIVGGAGKLFKRFTRDYSDPSVISYSDKSWNNGGVYKAIGLEYSHTTPPAYHYTRDYTTFENRVAYQIDKLEVFEPDKTEWENMQINGYDRIWDCGNDVYKNEQYT